MAEEKPPTWFIATTLFMLVVSGAWTLASTFPFQTSLRVYSIAAVAVANISFLLALLACVLAYLRSNQRRTWRTIMIYSFTAGILFLMGSILIYAVGITAGFPAQSD